MTHTTDEFLKPDYADIEIAEVVGDWLAELESRPVSPNTVASYGKGILSFTKSLTLHDQPHILGSITERNVLAWKSDMREGRIHPKPSNSKVTKVSYPCSPATIRSYLIVLKTFSNKWLKRRYTAHDLLELVELGKNHVELKDAFTPEDREKLLGSLEGQSFEHVRDRAFVQLLLATACRFAEIHTMTPDLDAKRVWVTLKGGRVVPVDVDGRALRDLKTYLGRRRLVADKDEKAVWLSDSGQPLTYWGAYGIFARLEARSGVHCNPHKFRHTVAQTMAQGSAAVADIQAVLHHTSDLISRRYIGNARQDVEAGLAKKWSLAG